MQKIKIQLINPGNYGKEELEGMYPCWPGEFIEWTPDFAEIKAWVDTFPTQGCDSIFETENLKVRIALLIEPIAFGGDNYKVVLEHKDCFDLIFSTYPNYGDGSSKFKYIPGGARSFIRPNERNIYNKQKNICSIASNKQMSHGHVFRHTIKNYIQENNPSLVDYINPPMDRKVEGLASYRYELVVENEDSPFFSEKPLDSMLTGCIPIYWSTCQPSYFKGFDTTGILFFSTLDEVIQKLENGYFTPELYESRLSAVRHNFEEAKKYVSLGDIIWNAGLQEYLNYEDTI